MTPLLVTGAGGFVGRRLLAALPAGMFSEVRLLTRTPERLTGTLPPGDWSIVAGDLLAPETLAPALAGVNSVLHLAAQTGKADRARMIATTGTGTAILVREAERAGVRRMILVSSIAAGFPDRRWYHYAEAKRAAEAAVRASRLDWLVVRPTMVFGPGSPVQTALTRLASAPLGICFGPGRVQVQPIHVDDLAAFLVAALGREPLGGRVVAAGGPELMSMAELLRRLRVRAKGTAGPFVRLPAGFFRWALGTVEPLLLPVLPFTAGQLASFVNPGEAPDPGPDFPRPRRSLDQMLDPAGSVI